MFPAETEYINAFASINVLPECTRRYIPYLCLFRGADISAPPFNNLVEFQKTV